LAFFNWILKESLHQEHIWLLYSSHMDLGSCSSIREDYMEAAASKCVKRL